MSSSLLVASILVLGWNAVLLMSVLLVKGISFQQEPASDQLMRRVQKEVNAEIETPDLNVRADDWKRSRLDGTASTYEASHAYGPSRQVVIETPYAEAPVTVATPDEEEVRNCSICLN